MKVVYPPPDPVLIRRQIEIAYQRTKDFPKIMIDHIRLMNNLHLDEQSEQRGSRRPRDWML